MRLRRGRVRLRVRVHGRRAVTRLCARGARERCAARRVLVCDRARMLAIEVLGFAHMLTPSALGLVCIFGGAVAWRRDRPRCARCAQARSPSRAALRARPVFDVLAFGLLLACRGLAQRAGCLGRAHYHLAYAAHWIQQHGFSPFEGRRDMGAIRELSQGRRDAVLAGDGAISLRRDGRAWSTCRSGSESRWRFAAQRAARGERAHRRRLGPPLLLHPMLPRT